jgi:hypothetical protein
VVVATSFAFYSHILAALLIPVEILWFLLYPRRDRYAWRGGVLALALLTLPYLPLLKWQAGLAFTTRQTGFPNYTFGRWRRCCSRVEHRYHGMGGSPREPRSLVDLRQEGLGLVWQRKWRTAVHCWPGGGTVGVDLGGLAARTHFHRPLFDLGSPGFLSRDIATALASWSSGCKSSRF